MAAELEEDEPWVASQTLKIPKVMAENTLLFLGITTTWWPEKNQGCYRVGVPPLRGNESGNGNAWQNLASHLTMLHPQATYLCVCIYYLYVYIYILDMSVCISIYICFLCVCVCGGLSGIKWQVKKAALKDAFDKEELYSLLEQNPLKKMNCHRRCHVTTHWHIKVGGQHVSKTCKGFMKACTWCLAGPLMSMSKRL